MSEENKETNTDVGSLLDAEMNTEFAQAVLNHNADLVKVVTVLDKGAPEQGYSWTTRIEMPEIKPLQEAYGVGVEKFAQQLVDETGLTLKELIDNSSINDHKEGPVSYAPVSHYPTVIAPSVMSQLISDPAPASLEEQMVIEYTTNELKGKRFIDVANGLIEKADVTVSPTISYEQYEELMLAIMEHDTVVKVAVFNILLAELLLVAKGMDVIKSPYASPVPVEHINTFLNRNLCLVGKWICFIDSFQVFGIYALKALKDHYKPEEHFPVIDDSSYVGRNVAMLFLIPEFMAHYFSIKEDGYQLSYFKQQFECMTFDGKNLTHFFRHKNNYMAAAFENLVRGYYNASDIDLGIFKNGVFAPDYPIGEFRAEDYPG